MVPPIIDLKEEKTPNTNPDLKTTVHKLNQIHVGFSHENNLTC